MGCYEEGEAAQRRGCGRCSNPHDSGGSPDEARCNREWADGFRRQERLEQDRRGEED